MTKKVRKKSAGKMEHYTVVGIHYRVPKDSRRMLAKKIPFSVVFKRQPKNEYDKNAIAVIVAADQFMAGIQIGYLRKEVAAVIAPLVDKGEISLPAFGIVDAVNVDKGTAEMKMALAKPKIAS